MIDFERFSTAMAAIGERCASTPTGEQLKMYHQFLSPKLSTEEFLEAARGVWISAVFFPPPIRFLEGRARIEWDKLLDVVASHNPPYTASSWEASWLNLSKDTRIVVNRLGGILSLKGSLGWDVARTYDRFVKMYSGALEDSADGVPIGAPSQQLLTEGDEK